MPVAARTVATVADRAALFCLPSLKNAPLRVGCLYGGSESVLEKVASAAGRCSLVGLQQVGLALFLTF